MDQDKKIAVLTITNTFKNVDLFRVHIHERSIRFDKKIESGIQKHPLLKSEVDELNQLWIDQKIQENQILPIVLYLMAKYGSYLKNFYFKKHELDKEGHYIEDFEENAYESEMAGFFEYFKSRKKLKRVSKIEFEKNIPNDTIANQYVENYAKTGARFFNGEIATDDSKTTWYFMVKDKSLIMTYEKNSLIK